MHRQDVQHAHPNYILIYFALLALLGVSIALGQIGNIYLMTGLVFGVAAIKALMVLRYFMHLKFEPLFIAIILISAALCLVVLFIGVYPDAVLRSGWK
jgi:caa(3)-type oxidase subunit IV